MSIATDITSPIPSVKHSVSHPEAHKGLRQFRSGQPIKPDFGKLADAQKAIDDQIKQFRETVAYRKDLAEAQQQYEESLREAASINPNLSIIPATGAATTSNSITID